MSLARVWAGVSLFAVAAVTGVNLYHAAKKVRPAPRVISGPAHVAVRQEQRLAPVRRALERNAVRGNVGYICDLPAAQMPHDHRSMEDYFASQFALVPWVLDADAAAFEWAVANLREARLAERMPAGFAVVEDFGEGVAILRKTPR